MEMEHSSSSSSTHRVAPGLAWMETSQGRGKDRAQQAIDAALYRLADALEALPEEETQTRRAILEALALFGVSRQEGTLEEFLSPTL